MTLYQHRFGGHLSAGDVFLFSWWANSTRTLTAAQAAAVTWATTLWNGATAGHGYRDHVVTTTGMDSVTTVSVDPSTGVQTGRTDTAVAMPGVVAGSAMPGDVALCVSLRTATPTRSGRGRFFLPQPAATQTTAVGRVLALLITDTIASLSGAWSGYLTASDIPVVYSRTGRLTRTITSYDIGDLFDTQRRRENKVVEARTSHTMP